MSNHRSGTGELTIGIVGPHDVVERVMLSGAAGGSYMSTAPAGHGAPSYGAPGHGAPSYGAPGQGAASHGGAGQAGSSLTAGQAPPATGVTVSGASWSGFGFAARLIAAAYRDEHEAAEKASRLGSSVDVCLFASPVPYEYARR